MNASKRPLYLYRKFRPRIVDQLRSQSPSLQDSDITDSYNDLAETARAADFVLVDPSAVEIDQNTPINLPIAALIKKLAGKPWIFVVDGSEVDVVGRIKRCAPEIPVLAQNEVLARGLDELYAKPKLLRQTRDLFDPCESLLESLSALSHDPHANGLRWGVQFNPALDLLDENAIKSAIAKVNANVMAFVAFELFGQERGRVRIHGPVVHSLDHIIADWNQNSLRDVGADLYGRSIPKISGIVNSPSGVFPSIDSSPLSSMVFVDVQLPKFKDWNSQRVHGILGRLTDFGGAPFRGSDEWFFREWVSGVELQLQACCDTLHGRKLEANRSAWFQVFVRLLHTCQSIGLVVPSEFCELALKIIGHQLVIAGRELRSFPETKFLDIADFATMRESIKEAAEMLSEGQSELKNKLLFASCFLERCESWDKREPVTLQDFATAGIQIGSQLCEIGVDVWGNSFGTDEIEAQIDEDLGDDVSVILEPTRRRFHVTVPRSAFHRAPKCGDHVKIQMWSAFHYWYGVSDIAFDEQAAVWTDEDRSEFIAGVQKLKDSVAGSEDVKADRPQDVKFAHDVSDE